MRPLILFAIASGVLLGLLAAAFVQEGPSTSHAGTAIRMDLEEAFHRSALAIEGTVRSAESGESEDGTIYTDWSIDVDRTFWGEHEAVRAVRLPGGVIESGRGMIIPGMPRLSVGEDVVLLLTQAGPSELRVPIGLAQGKYRIVTAADGTKTAVQSGEHLSLAGPQSVGAMRGMKLLDHAEFVARLEAARATRLAASGYGQDVQHGTDGSGAGSGAEAGGTDGGDR